MFPETVGRTLEEIEDIFTEGHAFAPWRIGKHTGKKTLADVIGQSKEVCKSTMVSRRMC